MKLGVISFQHLKSALVAGQRPFLQRRQPVVRRDHAPFPIHVAERKWALEGVAFEQKPQVRELLKVVDRYRRDFEPARALGNDEAFRRQAIQQLSQRADADAVRILERFEPELPRGDQAAEDDVVAQTAVDLFARRLDLDVYGTQRTTPQMILQSYDDRSFDY